MYRNPSRCHARLSLVVMSRVHASSPLISDACRYLFQPDQSRVTDLRRALGASHPATLPAVRLPERRSYFSFALHLISLWLCWNAPLKRSAWTVSKVCAGKLPPVLNLMDTYAPSSTLWTTPRLPFARRNKNLQGDWANLSIAGGVQPVWRLKLATFDHL